MVETRSARRLVGACAWLAALLPMLALAAFAAAYRFDIGRLADLPSIVGDTDVAQTLRIAGLLDMSAYLVVAPVVAYLHCQLGRRAPDLMALVTFCGFAYVLLGSLGGTIFATVGPPLVVDGSDLSRSTFGAFATFVTVTIWSTLESIFLGAWLLGVGWLLRPSARSLGTLAMVAAIGAFLSAARSGLTGHSVGDLPGLIDLLIVAWFGLYVPWMVWLGTLLLRGGSVPDAAEATR
jgi:hypothetical protein